MSLAPFFLLAAHVAGILLATCVQPENLTPLWLAVAILLSLWLPLHRSFWGWLPFGAAVLVTGYLNALLAFSPPADSRHISRYADNTTRIIEARLVSVEPRAAGGFRLQAEGRSVVLQQGEVVVQGRLQLSIESGLLYASPGQIIRWRGKLRRPALFGNPGEFDFPLHLAAQGIYVTGFVKKAEDLAVLANHPDRATAFLENLRQFLAAQIALAVPQSAAGPMQSLLLGLRGGISDEQRTVLAESGIAHLFAISGLHFGLLALLLYQVGKGLYVRSSRLVLWCPPQRILPVLLILPLGVYLLLSGDAFATRRAFLMAATVALLFACSRRTAPLVLLATVALLMLLMNPLALFQPGFQLSFAGLAGILAWLPPWQPRLAGQPTLLRWPAAMLLTTAAATLATAPATLWHFHLIAPGGLLANLFAIPLVAWGAVPAGLIGLTLLPASDSLAYGALQLSAWLVMQAIELAAVISHWPGLQAVRRPLTPAEAALAVGVLLTLLIPGGVSRNRKRRLAVFAATLLCSWLLWPAETGLQVTALSVGQGDATLLSLNHQEHYLVDGGGLPGTDFDPGERLIAPALGRLGIRRLKGVILTHNHPDHSTGLTYILRHLPVEAFLTAVEPQQLPQELKNVLQERLIPVQRIAPGWSALPSDPPLIFQLFVPHQQSQDANERSVIVYAGDTDQGVLLTGDLGKPGFRQLLADGLPGPVSLLKLPHHGSRLSDPALFLDQLQPDLAFVSAGRFNPYGFPHADTLAACAEREVPLYRTDLAGMLTFRLSNRAWQIDPFAKGFID